MRPPGTSRGAGGPAGPGHARASLLTIVRGWGRIGLVGFGGPPAHIALLRELVVERRGWLDAREFEDANAACSLLPGPASTQLSMYCALRAGGPAGAVVGGLAFVVPAVVLVLLLSLLFLGSHPPLWVRGAGAGAGAAVGAVAARAGLTLAGPSLLRVGEGWARRARWSAYLILGGAGVALGPYLVVVLLACGVCELLVSGPPRRLGRVALLVPGTLPAGGLGALVWTAIKVGALSFGGGFVIVPLMQSDAVHVHHWMSGPQFLDAVALGQVTPGPVVATVAAVGYAARGVGGGLLAAAVAFAPSFAFILLGGARFDRIRGNASARAFLAGAGPAGIGAILGAAVLLAAAIRETWQWPLLVAALAAMLVARRGVVGTLLTAGAIGVLAALAGAPVPR